MTQPAYSIDIDLEGLDETVANVEGFPLFLGRELAIAMESSLQLLEGQIRVRAPVNTGALRNSIGHQIRSAFPNLVGAVGSPLDYAPVMEFGRRPGAKMPPVDAIKLWVVRKLQIPPDEAEGVAFVIARSIARKGIEGRKYFAEGTEASRPFINRLFASAVARAVARANQ